MPTKYKGYTQAQNAAHKRYMQCYAEVRARVSKELRDAIQDHAQAQGESVNAFVRRAIQETIQRDLAAGDGPASTGTA